MNVSLGPVLGKTGHDQLFTGMLADLAKRQIMIIAFDKKDLNG